ncbi:MAG: 50S ribosomal protein L11 methyltransferase, partial [Proteobacteria bacterium]|nr:50S ribosomal protein L11 methyltransferase [Pseudomonadota bacterium]
RGVEVADAPDGRLTVTAWFDPVKWAEAEPDLAAFLSDLPPELALPDEAGEPSWTARRVPECDWVENWKAFFRPVWPAPNLVVRPPWETVGLGPGQTEVIIDPGQAFGTGHHASTAMCLRLLTGAAPGPTGLLDVGCGTGILALAGLGLGIPRAVGLDIDPLAVRATRHNAGLNGLADRLGLIIGGPECLRGSWPLVLANLTAKDLIDLAGDLTRLTAPGGRLIASGILTKRLSEVRARYGAPVWSLEKEMSEGEWSACGLIKTKGT